MTNIKEQMDLFWILEGIGEEDIQIDAETGDFYFWLGGEGENIVVNQLSRQEFESRITSRDV